MQPELGKRVMNVTTLAMLVWRLFASSFEHGPLHDDPLADALAQLSGVPARLATTYHAVVTPDPEPYLACATAPDALAMEFQCASVPNRS